MIRRNRLYFKHSNSKRSNSNLIWYKNLSYPLFSLLTVIDYFELYILKNV